MIIEPLSEREQEILGYVGQGWTNRQIAEHLYLSLGTVKSHTHNIYGKLGVTNRVQALKQAQEIGLLKDTVIPKVSAATEGAAQLPTPPNLRVPFVGREKELQQLSDDLHNPDLRLITILGAGGMGKTYLAIEAARRQQNDFRDGVFFVELAPLSTFDNQLFFSVRRFIQLLNSGASLEQCFRDAADNAPEPTAGVFRQVVADLTAGRDLLDTLISLETQLDTRHFSKMVSAISEQVRDGSDLASKMESLSRTLNPAISTAEVRQLPSRDYAEDMIVLSIAKALGYHFHADARTPRQQIMDFVADKQMLIVLDNCEHLLEGIEFLAWMLGGASDLKILTTSRERLNLVVETVYPLGGLEIMPVEEDRFRDCEAVRLLMQHVLQIDPTFDPTPQDMHAIARICHQTQGMPLAILLAVGWFEMLSLEEIAAELADSMDLLETDLRDIPARQRSVRAAFDASWNQLTPKEQIAFAQMSVFRGGFTRDAAKIVAGANLRMQQTLVNRALVTVDANGYTIHELLRQYGQERLAEMGRLNKTREAHGLYYLNALADTCDDLYGGDQIATMDRIMREADNLWSAWRWALRAKRVDLVNAAIETIYITYYIRGRGYDCAQVLSKSREELLGYLPKDDPLIGRLDARISLLMVQAQVHQTVFEDAERALRIAEANEDRFEMAIAMEALATYHLVASADYDKAIALYGSSLEIHRQQDRHFYIARNLHKLGYAAVEVEGIEAMMDYTREARHIAAKNDNFYSRSMADTNLAAGVMLQGAYDEAAIRLEASIPPLLQLDNRKEHAHTNISLAEVFLLLGDFEQGREMAETGLQEAKLAYYDIGVAYAQAVLALYYGIVGDYARAKELAEFSMANNGHQGDTWSTVHRAMALACYGLRDTETAFLSLRQALKTSAQMGSVAAMTWLLPVTGLLLIEAGRHEEAATSLALAMTHPQSPVAGLLLWPLIDEAKANLKDALGDTAYSQMWEAGKNQNVQAVLAAALAEQ